MEVTKTHNVPTILVILGATGDLSKRKLIPALFDLFGRDVLPDHFQILGNARSEMTDDAFREYVKDVLVSHGHESKKSQIADFLDHLSYVRGDFTCTDCYAELSDKMIEIENSFGQCTNKLFYLAVPPQFYDSIFRNLADSGLTIPCSDDTGWTRILVEKPFGNDVDTAQALDKTLSLLFKEEQIFRIDHYLGKETLQNILSFRFSNLIFEPLWNNKYIEKVELKLHEELGVEHRGAFYDTVGALRDVGQNHLLQMLAFAAMRNPGKLDAHAIRTERARVLKALCPLPQNDLAGHVMRAQYDSYTAEPDTQNDSQTETYFKIKAFVDLPEWEGVPFYLESGKGLASKSTEIVIHFKKTASCLCPPHADMHHENILRFNIQPNEGISITFWAKKPGFDHVLEPKEMSFEYGNSENDIPDAYERILYDAIKGDLTLFTSSDEVSAAWQFITPILKSWDVLPLYGYPRGANELKSNI